MTTHHNIHIIDFKVDLKATYRDGKFRKLEHLRGKLEQNVLNSIGRTIPKLEANFDVFKKEFEGRVIYTKGSVKEKTNFTRFLDAWNEFYKKDKGFYPKVDVAERVSLTRIIKYLKSINNDNESEALLNWQVILDNWQLLPEFYQKKIDLKKINSNFNVIITELKESIRKQTGSSHSESRKKANDIANKYF